MSSGIVKPLLATASVGVVPAPVSINNTLLRIGVFFVAHVPLALLMINFKAVGIVHALLTPVIGMVWVLHKRHLERAAYLAAYITGAEVLWRMAHLPIIWEIGKYATVILLITALLRQGKIKWSPLPLIYFLLLLPSAFLTLHSLDMEYARKSLSFNLSGPLALMVSVWFFINLKITLEQLHRIFFVLIGPVIGIAAVTAFTTFSASAIKFSDQSNKATSGGFGPNQVSAILGFGVLLAMFFLLDSKTGWSIKILMFGVMAVLGTQSALTFSRGGLYMAAGGVILAFLFLLKDGQSRIRMILIVTTVLVFTNYILLPYLDTFTEGSLSSRFQDTNPTGRDDIVLIDLQIWAENPIFGVGPGMGMLYRASVYKYVAAHTEFSRLLAEHGIFGAAAILLLLVMAVQGIRRAKPIIGKTLAASLIGWSFFFLMIDAMRLMAPALAFGLGYATILSKASLPSILPRNRLFRSRHQTRRRMKAPTGPPIAQTFKGEAAHSESV